MLSVAGNVEDHATVSKAPRTCKATPTHQLDGDSPSSWCVGVALHVQCPMENFTRVMDRRKESKCN